MWLRILLFVDCEVSRLMSIKNNLARRTNDGKKYKMKQNSVRGCDTQVDAFLGEDGALVVGVEVEGNQLAMLLRNSQDQLRILRWNFRQGGAVDWFCEKDGRYDVYPASSSVRNVASFFFTELDRTHIPAELAEGQLHLVQIDCTSGLNQSEWELRPIVEHPGQPLFSTQPGWWARHRGFASFLGDPFGWIAAVKVSATAAAAATPAMPVLIWIRNEDLWEGTGFKTISELMYRFVSATVASCVFLTMEELVAAEDLVEHLCLCAYLLMVEELHYAQWYNLKVFDASRIMDYVCSVLQVFRKDKCVHYHERAKDKHHHIWAHPSTVSGANWARVQATYRWVAEDAAEGHVVDGFFNYVGVGPMCFHQHCDLKHMELSQRQRDLFSAIRGAPLPPVANRPALKALAVNRGVENESKGVEGAVQGRPKKRKLNRSQRAAEAYTSADKAWLARGRALIERLATKGFGGILPLGKFDMALSHMQKK